jgi:hypothetical protein
MLDKRKFLKMPNFSRLFCLIVLTVVSAGCCSGPAATLNVPCDFLSISNACMTAKEGDLLWIQPGDCVISNQININRNVSFTIAGSGTNLTTLRGSAAARTAICISSDSANVFTVRDLNLVCVPGEAVWLSVGNSGVEFPGPYHIYNIQMTNVMGRGISMGAGLSHDAYGLLDHCTFIAATNGYFGECIDFAGADVNAWTNANPIGTSNVQCVEDSYFWTLPSGNGGNGFFDSYRGPQIVFRHNYCDGWAPIGGHGYDSQPTAIRTWEVYDNIFTNFQGANTFMVWRGGSGVVFSNQCWGNTAVIAYLLYYRGTNYVQPNVRSGWGQLGIPGQGYIINFQGMQAQGGVDQCFTNQPEDGEGMGLGAGTDYFFVTNLNETAFNQVNVSGRGGGTVLIGPTVAQTITNFYNAVNVISSTYGISWTNFNGSPSPLYKCFGYDMYAIGYDDNNLYLTNGLDCNTNIYGYPAFDQPGVIGEYKMQGSPLTTNFVQIATKWPVYVWGNTLNGTSNDTTAAGSNTNLIQQNRDYFVGIAPPTNVYVPLVYPHPLQALEVANQSNAEGSPPANLRAVKAP